MASVTKHLTSVGDVCGPIFEGNGRINHVAIFISSLSVGTFILELSGQTDPNGNDEWCGPIEITDNTETNVTQLVGNGNNQYAHTDVRGARKVRVRKTAGADDNTLSTVTLIHLVSSMS